VSIMLCLFCAVWCMTHVYFYPLLGWSVDDVVSHVTPGADIVPRSGDVVLLEPDTTVEKTDIVAKSDTVQPQSTGTEQMSDDTPPVPADAPIALIDDEEEDEEEERQFT